MIGGMFIRENMIGVMFERENRIGSFEDLGKIYMNEFRRWENLEKFRKVCRIWRYVYRI